jgi:cytochrome c553
VTVGLLLVVLAAGPSPSSQAPAGDAEAGQTVFESNCAMCHGADASGMMGMHPSLRGAVQRLSLEGVEVTVRQGRRTTPPMPAFEGRLSDQQINDVIAYIASLPEGPRNFGPGQGMMTPEPPSGTVDLPERSSSTGLLRVLVAILLIALIALVGVALVALVRRVRAPATRSSARDELDFRYASGELTRDEYLRRSADLER